MSKLLSVALLAAATFAFNGAAIASEAPAAEHTAAAESAAPAQEAHSIELQDGTMIQLKGEEVWVIGKDGQNTPAPDGTHTAKDGKSYTTKDGKLSNS